LLWSSDAGWSSKFFSGEELDVHLPASLLQVQATQKFAFKTRTSRVICAVQHRVPRDDVLVARRNTRPPHDAGHSSFVFLFITKLTSFSQEVLLNDVKVEEWNFKFGSAFHRPQFHSQLVHIFTFSIVTRFPWHSFVIPGSTNSWQVPIELFIHV
jgi:hypothetical protein